MLTCGGRQKFIIRTSDRGIFRSCRQRWDFSSKIRQNYEPKSTQIHFDFGSSIHVGMQTYYEPILFKTMQPEIRTLLAIAEFKTSEEAYRSKAKAFSIDGILSDEVREEFDDRMKLGIGMLEHYGSWAPQVDIGWTPHYVEVEFEVPIPVCDLPSSADKHFENGALGFGYKEDVAFLEAYCYACKTHHPVFYQGRIDLIMEDPHGRLWIWDHKTAGQFGSTQYLDLDDQGGSYLWAIRKQLNIDCIGVIYNRMLKSAPRMPTVLASGGLSKNKQQRTTYELYMKAIAENNEPYADYADFLEFLRQKPNQFFQRVEVYRGAEELVTTEHRILMEAVEMLGDPMIYPNPGQFNCMGCAFIAPCLATQDGSDVQYMLSTMYRKRDNDASTGDTNGTIDRRVEDPAGSGTT